MANQALNNLKTIHNLQKEGSILEKLREIRALKQSLEDFSRQAVQAKKSIEASEAAAAASKPVENVSSLSSAQPEKAPETKVDSSVCQKCRKNHNKNVLNNFLHAKMALHHKHLIANLIHHSFQTAQEKPTSSTVHKMADKIVNSMAINNVHLTTKSQTLIAHKMADLAEKVKQTLFLPKSIISVHLLAANQNQ